MEDTTPRLLSLPCPPEDATGIRVSAPIILPRPSPRRADPSSLKSPRFNSSASDIYIVDHRRPTSEKELDETYNPNKINIDLHTKEGLSVMLSDVVART